MSLLTPNPLLKRQLILPELAATERLGQCFAQAFTSLYHAGGFTGLRIYLHGELGAGKTALARAALLALGVSGRIRSPTYTLVEHYALELLSPVSNTLDTLDIYHFDLYRFTHPEEWTEAGFQEYLAARALCLIEWPERAGGLLGAPDLALMLEVEGDGRRLTADAFSRAGQRILAQCFRRFAQPH
ncbi:tRNA (adenosine(37)-N6)-threonylcarbamoyltransferase complex ATPase subunit type 1 TsaE [Candidatus Glomeribacter gigasporarum]|uniref:tRNA (adenosine(37)-N6)-threonylcarbamoyltransferase complex ATPase subunit type 1 TsaE n=1 Tax=Candidatus Glomeribacter gigasporarum TaxID=132144 RepID=UPI0002DF7FD9|nr:tRNA (adenosine(37)-N6)-threonylcarbamoyltransferase complex ATPase subunit type 1 TsaE [Candidatus Glomeribacter gigasporarum]